MRKLVCIIALVGLAACTKPTETEAEGTSSEGAESRAVVDEIYAGFKAGDMDRVAGAMAADIV